MNRFIGSTALALTLAFGAPALAQEDAQLREQAGIVLADHGYGNVDTSLLTMDQLARLQTLDGQAGSDVQRRQIIDDILVMDAGTATFVTEEMQALFADPEFPELRSNARTLLGEAGFDPELAETLTMSQLAQLWTLQEQPERNLPGELASRVGAIVDDS